MIKSQSRSRLQCPRFWKIAVWWIKKSQSQEAKTPERDIRTHRPLIRGAYLSQKANAHLRNLCGTGLSKWNFLAQQIQLHIPCSNPDTKPIAGLLYQHALGRGVLQTHRPAPRGPISKTPIWTIHDDSTLLMNILSNNDAVSDCNPARVMGFLFMCILNASTQWSCSRNEYCNEYFRRKVRRLIVHSTSNLFL